MNKILLIIIGIISIALACIYLFAFVTVHLTISYDYLTDNLYEYIVLLIVTVLSFASAFGGVIFLHYTDLPDAELKKKRKLILIWSVIFIISTNICGFLGFIVYVCLSDNIKVASKIDYIEEIKELEKLNKKGLITEEEFTCKKKKILDI